MYLGGNQRAMATHFSANQYEDAYRSNRLQNYQVSNKYKERPATRRGATKIISNDRGHIVAPARRSLESPWGNFLGTWDMSKKTSPQKETLPSTAPKTPAEKTETAVQASPAEQAEPPKTAGSLCLH
ncbi:hypothetical protein ACHWQZ_G019341 [Mnemiopsis leidyi]